MFIKVTFADITYCREIAEKEKKVLLKSLVVWEFVHGCVSSVLILHSFDIYIHIYIYVYTEIILP